MRCAGTLYPGTVSFAGLCARTDRYASDQLSVWTQLKKLMQSFDCWDICHGGRSFAATLEVKSAPSGDSQRRGRFIKSRLH
jgi:hypothetical protein